MLGGEKVSPRTGRPKTENPKSIKMNIRISPQTAQDLKECAEALHVPRVAVIERGIQSVKAELNKK
jgi:hypothetical protein|nr:MAG TPA: Alginate and motility regulator [Bacteriophage sp.]